MATRLGGVAALPVQATHGLVRPHHEGTAVQQPRERIVLRQMQQSVCSGHALGNVLDLAHDGHRLAARIDERRVEPQAVLHAAVGPDERGLDPVLAFGPGQQAVKRLAQRADPCAIAHQIQERFALVGGVVPAKPLSGATGAMHKAQLRIQLHHGQRAVFHVRKNLLIGCTQRFRGHFELVHLQRRIDQTTDLPILIKPGMQADGEPDLMPFEVANLPLVGDLMARQGAINMGAKLRAGSLAVQRGQSAAQQFLGTHLEPVGIGLVGVQDVQAGVDHADRRACMASDDVQQVRCGQ